MSVIEIIVINVCVFGYDLFVYDGVDEEVMVIFVLFYIKSVKEGV